MLSLFSFMPFGFHDDECGFNANKFDILKECEAIWEKKIDTEIF